MKKYLWIFWNTMKLMLYVTKITFKASIIILIDNVLAVAMVTVSFEMAENEYLIQFISQLNSVTRDYFFSLIQFILV